MHMKMDGDSACVASNTPWDEKTCYNAASGPGTIECLKYAVDNGCPIDKNRCVSIAECYKNDKILEYLLSLP
jgi:hypothetical protein